MTRPSRWLPVVLSAALSLAAGRAHAGDAAAAETLFREGRALMGAGKVDAACSKFAESERLDPSPGTRLNLAACLEKQGRLASAWAEFVGAAELARSRGAATQADEAKKRAAALVTRLPRLTVTVSEPVMGLSVRRDDVELAGESLGASLPVDPGTHRIIASAPGHEPVTLDVELREGESRDVLVPALPAVAEPSPAPSPEAAKAAPVASPSPVAPSKAPAARPASAARLPAPHSHDAVLGWVIGGAGVALAATGGALYLLAVSDDHNAQKLCAVDGHYGCHETALAAGRERDTLATLATVSGGLGLAGIGVGLYFLLRPEHPDRAGAAAHGPMVLPAVTSHGTALYLWESFE